MSDLFKIDTEIKQLLHTEQVHSYQMVPSAFSNDKKLLILETSDEFASEKIKNELEIILGYTIDFKIIERALLTQKISFNYPRNTAKKHTQQLNYNEDFLINIIQNAAALSCSDIHFEIFENKARIRFRLDGKLTEQYVVLLNVYPILVNKIKILAQLDISEKRLPQDGRIKINNNHSEFDIRVSVLPSLYGEKVVLRLLSKDATHIDLTSLGFDKHEYNIYASLIQKSNGIILVSGPTGSGKTTTLYATLKRLNKESTNILTVEDPIEYTLEGINQVQLKENIGLDFSKVLKTFLRQDPDIIMVGEIRDVDTANIAIRAALTGHLVLSTIHTNSAWATVSRLIDMGIPTYLIADTLIMSVAQRLVRLLCNHCKNHIVIDEIHKELLHQYKIDHYYKPQGCEHCHQTGYVGRQAIYEILPITSDVIDLIKSNSKSAPDIKNSLQDKAIQLLREGKTSMEEIYSYII